MADTVKAEVTLSAPVIMTSGIQFSELHGHIVKAREGKLYLLVFEDTGPEWVEVKDQRPTGR